MKRNLVCKTSITIDADGSKVWKAITTPHLIKKYLFATTTIRLERRKRDYL
jgi:uncharacterized protein YndB with AHSA1/START domain